MTSATEGSGIKIAEQWANLPPKHLAAALAALEPQLVREHELRLRQIDAREAEVRRGQNFGLIIALVMLIAAVVVAWHGMQWLAVVFTGPGLLALAKLFVMRSSDAEDMKAVAAAASVPQPAAAIRVPAGGSPKRADSESGA